MRDDETPRDVWLVARTSILDRYPCRCLERWGPCSAKYCPCSGRLDPVEGWCCAHANTPAVAARAQSDLWSRS